MMKYFELLCVNYFALNNGRYFIYTCAIRYCNIFFGRGGREGKIEDRWPSFGRVTFES